MKHMIQPFGIDMHKNVLTDTKAVKHMHFYEADKTNTILNISFIPSSTTEWIICYNDNNDISEFICIGCQNIFTTLSLKEFDHYFGIRFDNTGCYFNKGCDIKTYPVNITDNIFRYEPAPQSYEMQLIKDFHNSFDYDIEDFQNEILLHKTAIEDNLKGAYQIIFHEVLPYKTPIAFQGSLTLIRDMYGYPVNDTNNHSKNNRIQKLHLAILPLKEKTTVLAFYHKRDRKYKSLKSQFNSSARLKKLDFLNYLIFAYTENYYFSPKIKEKIRTNDKLVLLSQELFGKPNLGQYVGVDSYKRVEPDEIPNFLLEEWAII